ncbi:aminotransferase class I/II-fold pyridoxal phosphate-dependent enzyme [Fontisubflavum oceani]|uniref:pyridoxal phosphate-dependent aminotransferase n=1 Tax=Fontisubflavum oceani TaxID=2978973 RepID=UPI0025B5D868|nr:aminotransferase class I/II-fold pyridoxal phosphate-dependent enzyme [Fontisubflavum oceani]WJY20726.1 aminotransferase class I/II-fold pyridoxal phosphate-dependent enzyme [Fontisubflavum oceani]
MQPSTRIRTLTGTEDDGWGLFIRARSMIAAGEEVLELTIGEHDIRTDPRILEAIFRSARDGHTGYAMVPGIPKLREAVAKRLRDRTGVPTTPDNILITPGGQAALFASHHAACDQGDRALFIDPYYATYPGTIRAVGAEAVPVQARPEDGFQPRQDVLMEAAQGARSLLINTPNNPTGVVYTPDTIAGIAEVAEAQDLWLISDEVYDTQVWDGHHISPRALPGMAERTLVVGSLSKSHAMTGSRLGWVAGPAEVIDRLITLATHTTYGVPGYIQDAGLYALSLGAEFEAEIGAPFRRRRDILNALLAGQQVIRAVPAQGAMYAMLDIRATGLTGEGFANALLDAEKIAVMPGESFGDAAAGHIRVALTLPDDAFAEAASRLIRFATARAATPAAE